MATAHRVLDSCCYAFCPTCKTLTVFFKPAPDGGYTGTEATFLEDSLVTFHCERHGDFQVLAKDCYREQPK